MLPRSTRKINLFLQASRPIVNDVTRDPLFYNPNALTSCISEWEGERERERSPCMIRDLRSLRFKPVRLGEAEMEKNEDKMSKATVTTDRCKLLLALLFAIQNPLEPIQSFYLKNLLPTNTLASCNISIKQPSKENTRWASNCESTKLCEQVSTRWVKASRVT